VREGLDCHEFERRLQQPCRNLAISAGTPLDVLHIARTIDDRRGSRVSVTGLFPKIMHSPLKPAYFDSLGVASVFASGAWRRLDARAWRDVAYGLFEDLSPTLTYRDGLRELWGVVRKSPAAAWNETLTPVEDRLLSDEATLPEEYFSKRMGVINGDASPSVYSAIHVEALKRFIALERQRGNRVVLVDFPTRPGYETTVSKEGRSFYASLTEELASRADITFVRTSDLPVLGLEDFRDFTHLAASGRRKVSSRLADLLARADQKGASTRVGAL
jgi:hypothetical protein